jgi:photosystem II stability/assembly factor-like uncharacterized protein
VRSRKRDDPRRIIPLDETDRRLGTSRANDWFSQTSVFLEDARPRWQNAPMATYMAVGDDGTIVCKGDGCSGDQNSGTGKHLLGVARAGINRTNGSPLMLAVGDDGMCLRFVGDGEWQSLSTGTSRDLNAVSFAPKTRVAWIVGDDGTILKTTNGGSSFGVQTSNTTKHLRSVWAVDEQLVYACGDGVGVWRTENGGSIWEKIHHGAPVGGAGTGTTIINMGNFYSVHAVGDKVMVVGSSGGVIASSNRGHTWGAKRITSKKLRAGWYGADGFAAAVGDDGALFTNPPGDVSWTKRDSGTSRDLNGVIRSGNSLVVVGDEGEVLQSTDMGATWSKGTRGSKHLNAVA